MDGEYDLLNLDLNLDEQDVPLDSVAEAEAEDVDQNIPQPVKHTVKRTNVAVLNYQRLTGPRGLSALPMYFNDIKLKGKGYEAEDLNCIMHNLEQWVHRLFPKFTFDDTLNKIEKLGSKSQVKTYLKKMKFDLHGNDNSSLTENLDQPVENSDFPGHES